MSETMKSDIYIEFNGRRVASSAMWDGVDEEIAIAAIKAFREIIGKPTEINGRFLPK